MILKLLEHIIVILIIMYQLQTQIIKTIMSQTGIMKRIIIYFLILNPVKIQLNLLVIQRHMLMKMNLIVLYVHYLIYKQDLILIMNLKKKIYLRKMVLQLNRKIYNGLFISQCNMKMELYKKLEYLPILVLMQVV